MPKVKFSATIGEIARVRIVDFSKIPADKAKTIRDKQKHGKRLPAGIPMKIVSKKITGLFTVGSTTIICLDKEYTHSGYTVSSLVNKQKPVTPSESEFDYSIGEAVTGEVDDIQRVTDEIKRIAKAEKSVYNGKVTGKVTGYGLFGSQKYLYVKPLGVLKGMTSIRIKQPKK